MLCHGLSQEEVVRTWAPFVDWVKARPEAYAFKGDPLFFALPARAFWDPATLRDIPGVVLHDDRPGAPADNLYWASNRGEAGQVLHAYQSAWLPNSLLAPSRRGQLADALIRAAEVWSVTLHTNKGLGGGSPAAIAAARETATNPEVLDAFALVICAAEEPPAWPGIPGHEHRVRQVILNNAKGLFDDIRTDPLGSLICLRRPRPASKGKRNPKPLKIMLAAHMDQIGFVGLLHG